MSKHEQIEHLTIGDSKLFYHNNALQIPDTVIVSDELKGTAVGFHEDGGYLYFSSLREVNVKEKTLLIADFKGKNYPYDSNGIKFEIEIPGVRDSVGSDDTTEYNTKVLCIIIQIETTATIKGDTKDTEVTTIFKVPIYDFQEKGDDIVFYPSPDLYQRIITANKNQTYRIIGIDLQSKTVVPKLYYIDMLNKWEGNLNKTVKRYIQATITGLKFDIDNTSNSILSVEYQDAMLSDLTIELGIDYVKSIVLKDKEKLITTMFRKEEAHETSLLALETTLGKSNKTAIKDNNNKLVIEIGKLKTLCKDLQKSIDKQHP